MRGYFIDTQNRTHREVQTDGLESYYSLIGCRCISIPVRRIGGVPYRIVADDEGTFVDDPLISAIDLTGEVMLVGSLIIQAMEDQDGNLCDLTDADIANIRRHIRIVQTALHPDGLVMLVGCEY